jgi:hypothetical protein
MARLPVDDGRLVSLPLFDHHRIGGAQHDALASVEHMVLQLATAREPDATTQHAQFAAARVDAHRLPPVHPEGPAMKQLELRIHHQSPGCRRMRLFRHASMIVPERPDFQ